MMKDRHIIYKVIAAQRMDRTKRSFRVYQILKLIRREFIIEMNQQHKIPHKTVNEDIQKHIIESFLICGNPLENEPNSKVCPLLRNDQIFSLIRLCGGSTCLTKEECFILLKKIHLN